MPKRKRTTTELADVPKRLRPSSEARKVKEVDRYTEISTHKKIEIIIPKGKGKKLEDCGNGELFLTLVLISSKLRI